MEKNKPLLIKSHSEQSVQSGNVVFYTDNGVLYKIVLTESLCEEIRKKGYRNISDYVERLLNPKYGERETDFLAVYSGEPKIVYKESYLSNTETSGLVTPGYKYDFRENYYAIEGVNDDIKKKMQRYKYVACLGEQVVIKKLSKEERKAVSEYRIRDLFVDIASRFNTGYFDLILYEREPQVSYVDYDAQDTPLRFNNKKPYNYMVLYWETRKPNIILKKLTRSELTLMTYDQFDDDIKQKLSVRGELIDRCVYTIERPEVIKVDGYGLKDIPVMDKMTKKYNYVLLALEDSLLVIKSSDLMKILFRDVYEWKSIYTLEYKYCFIISCRKDVGQQTDIFSPDQVCAVDDMPEVLNEIYERQNKRRMGE